MSEPMQVIPDETLLSYKHPLQPKRFGLALFFALVLFPLVVAALVVGSVFLVVPLFAFLFWLSGRAWFATFMGNSILVSEANYPRIYRIGEDLRSVIGYHKPVSIFVYEQGNFNASLIKFFFYRRAVFLNSELLETGVTDDELRWLIGRFIGYLWARRKAGFWGWTVRAAEKLLIFNVFLLPYERALVYTGDRIALGVINGEITSAASAMQKLFVGRQLGYSLNPNGIVDQHRQVKGSFFAFLARVGMTFPHMTARYVDLIGFAKERFPSQFERFEAGNPGLPPDLQRLGALSDVTSLPPGARDPIWVSLGAALLVVAGSAMLTVKLIVPQFSTAGLREAILPTRAAVQESAPSQSVIPVTVRQTPTLYTSAAGGFSANFSAEPVESSDQIALSDTDTITLYKFRHEEPGLLYTVLYCDYPPQYVSGDPQLFLSRVRDGLVESVKGTISSDEAVDFHGVPGRSFRITDADGSAFTARDFLDGRRLFQVIAAGSGAKAEEFLNSFQISERDR